MSERNEHREKLKSLFDKWNAEFVKLEDIQRDSDDALKDLKRSLSNTWAAFEQGVK